MTLLRSVFYCAIAMFVLACDLYSEHKGESSPNQDYIDNEQPRYNFDEVERSDKELRDKERIKAEISMQNNYHRNMMTIIEATDLRPKEYEYRYSYEDQEDQY